MNREVHTQINEKYKDSNEMFALGKFDLCLTSARQCLELIVYQLCRENTIPTSTDGKAIENVELINQLNSIGILDDAMAGKFHHLRQLGNAGAHISEYTVTREDARRAIETLTEIVKFFDGMSHRTGSFNEPMLHPDYYANTRRYLGKWALCYTRESLLVIPEYNELEEKAYNGDIEAMLDIASGFLTKQPNFNSFGMVLMPQAKYHGELYPQSENAFDARYYYWVDRAVQYALWNDFDPNRVPLKYMATACVEALKFALCTKLSTYYFYFSFDNEGEKVYHNQYELHELLFNDGSIPVGQLAYGYGDDRISPDPFQVIVFLQKVIKEFGPSVVSPIHNIKSDRDVYYLWIGIMCLDLEDRKLPIPECRALNSNIQGKTYYEVLEAYKNSHTDIYANVQKQFSNHKEVVEDKKSRKISNVLKKVNKILLILMFPIGCFWGTDSLNAISATLNAYIVALIIYYVCGRIKRIPKHWKDIFITVIYVKSYVSLGPSILLVLFPLILVSVFFLFDFKKRKNS